MENNIVNADWKRMGFRSEKEYIQFLDEKLKRFISLMETNGKVLSVFQRLKDR